MNVSTIAMSAYNLMAMAKGPVTASQLEEGLGVYGYPTEALEDALGALIERGWVERGEDKLITLKDSLSRQAIQRDDSGEPGDDGWRGWRVGDPINGLVQIEEAIR